MFIKKVCISDLQALALWSLGCRSTGGGMGNTFIVRKLSAFLFLSFSLKCSSRDSNSNILSLIRTIQRLHGSSGLSDSTTSESS